MHCRIFCNLADSSRLLASKKKIRKSWSPQPKIKPTTCGYSGPGFLEKPKKLRLFQGFWYFAEKKQNFAEFSGANLQEAGKSADFVREKSKFAEKSNFEGFSGANS